MKKLLVAALLALSLAGCVSTGNYAPPRTTPTSPPRNDISIKVPMDPRIVTRPAHSVPKPVIPKLPYKPSVPDVKLPAAVKPPAAIPHPSIVTRWYIAWELMRHQPKPSDVVRDVAPEVTQVIPQITHEDPVEHHRFKHWVLVALGAFGAIGLIIWRHERKPVAARS